MADIFSKAKRSEIMRKIRSKDTAPELLVRRYLFKKGFRYRLYKKNLPGNPDVVLAKYRTVIFVQGCFWHGHACKIGSGKRKPKTNIKYWGKKLAKNMERDKENMSELRKKGWKVLRIWECAAYRPNNIEKIVTQIKNN